MIGQHIDVLTERADLPHYGDGAYGAATFSRDMRYRYRLTRRWDWRPVVTWWMLNPSKAGAFHDDPTIRKCVTFARRWGYGGIHVINLFSLIATNPRELVTDFDPIGPETAAVVGCLVSKPGCDVVAAWGDGGTLRDRDVWAAGLMARAGIKPWCLGTTKAGNPKHPGRLAYATERVRWPLV